MTLTHLVTADELLAMGSDAPYELWEGVLKEVSPSSAWPGVVGARLQIFIGQFVLDRGLGFLDNLGVALGFAQFDQFEIVLDLLGEVADGLDLDVQFVALAHDVARLLGVRPEVGGFSAVVQVFEAGFGCIPVKDASSAGSAPARFRRRSFGFLRAFGTLKSLGAHVVDPGRRINLAP